jgi:hypothetical protein
MRSLSASGVADLSKTLSGSHYIHCSYGPKHEIVLLSRDKPPRLDPERRTYSLPPFLYWIQCLQSTGWEVVLELAPTQKSYDFVQPLPGRRWLLVDSRLSPDRAPNADIFDEKGTLLSSIVAGDGIEHVQATSAGDIWIGYFDEGIYSGGNLEGSGLVCLTEEGRPCLQYWIDVAEPNALPCIDDCYALNVSGEDEVWTSYYSNFPVVRLRRKTLDKAWLDFPAIAVRAFAVDGDRLLMTPAYRREGPLYLVNLQDSSIEEIQVVGPDGQPLHFDHSFGRGPLLCFASVSAALVRALFAIDLRSI